MNRPKKIELEWLIYGWKKGGTHFVADMLKNSGYPCEHEAFQCDGEGLYFCGENCDGIKADCSYITGEWMNHPTVEHVPVIRINRDPMDVVESVVRGNLNRGIGPDWEVVFDEILQNYSKLTSLSIKRFKYQFDVHSDSEMIKLCHLLGVECYSKFPATIWKPGKRDTIALVINEITKSEKGMMVVNLRKQLGY